MCPRWAIFRGCQCSINTLIIMEKELNSCNRLVVIIDIDYSLRRTGSSNGILLE